MPIVKAVLDTNILVSVAFAQKGLTKQLRDMIADDMFLPVTSKQIIKELYRVLNYPHIVKRFKPSKNDINEFMGLIISRSLITLDLYIVDKIQNDVTDNKFLACALEGKADFIVSRDPHLRNIKHYQGIQIIDATTLISEIKK